jgi:hypothetical protein
MLITISIEKKEKSAIYAVMARFFFAITCINYVYLEKIALFSTRTCANVKLKIKERRQTMGNQTFKPIKDFTEDELNNLPMADLQVIEERKNGVNHYLATFNIGPMNIIIPMKRDDAELIASSIALDYVPKRMKAALHIRLTKGIRRKGYHAGQEMKYLVEIVVAGTFTASTYLSDKQKFTISRYQDLDELFIDVDHKDKLTDQQRLIIDGIDEGNTKS